MCKRLILCFSNSTKFSKLCKSVPIFAWLPQFLKYIIWWETKNEYELGWDFFIQTVHLMKYGKFSIWYHNNRRWRCGQGKYLGNFFSVFTLHVGKYPKTRYLEKKGNLEYKYLLVGIYILDIYPCCR